MREKMTALLFGVALGFWLCPDSRVFAETIPASEGADPRIRVADYDPGQVYVLQGRVGYQIDLQFAPTETFVGLASGDIEGLSFVSQGNHLFVKPKAVGVATNLTILTSKNQYQFDYSVLPSVAATEGTSMYVVRFRYPNDAVGNVTRASDVAIDRSLKDGEARRTHNTDYWFCGADLLRPVAAWDDGVQTHLDFGQRSEQPAIFVRNDDGTESLLNFSIESGEVIVHRIARRLILRRGALTGCVVNKGFEGAGERLPSGTIAPDVRRAQRPQS